MTGQHEEGVLSETRAGVWSLEDEVVVFLRRISRAVDLHSKRLLAKSGLTGPQLATLREVARLGPVSATVLARAVHLSQPTVTGIVDRLVRRGLVVRTRDGSDRRNVWVAITENGTALLASAPSLLQDGFLSGLRRLGGDQQRNLVAALQTIAAMMELGEGLPNGPANELGSASAGPSVETGTTNDGETGQTAADRTPFADHAHG